MNTKTIKVTLTFEMSEQQSKLFMQSSIERVINTSVRIIEAIPSNTTNEEEAFVNLEDWHEWKATICGLWNGMHDAIYRHLAGMSASDKPYRL